MTSMRLRSLALLCVGAAGLVLVSGCPMAGDAPGIGDSFDIVIVNRSTSRTILEVGAPDQTVAVQNLGANSTGLVTLNNSHRGSNTIQIVEATRTSNKTDATIQLGVGGQDIIIVTDGGIVVWEKLVSANL